MIRIVETAADQLSESRIIADYTDFTDYAPAEQYVYSPRGISNLPLQRSGM